MTTYLRTSVLNSTMKHRSEPGRSGIHFHGFSAMRSQSVRRWLLLSCFVGLLFGAAVAGSGRAPHSEAAIAPAQPNSRQGNHLTQRSRFDCLPKDVRLNDVVTYARTTKGNVTVEKKLIEMKAQCRNRKLVDAKRREIRFFRPSCWGNPPSDYLEIQQRENAELQKLRATHAVIVFGCNPMISKLLLTPAVPAGYCESIGLGLGFPNGKC
jgi:hypothetical protein